MTQYKNVIKTFFQVVEKGKIEEILRLFSPVAMIHSPLFGSRDAAHFFQEMLSNTKDIKMQIKAIFNCADHPNIACALVAFSAKVTSGHAISVEGVDIFDFTPGTDKIQSLKFIYDTHQIRSHFHK
jgi:hypothetical protein